MEKTAFIKEHYKLNVNVCIRVQLFNQTFVQGLEYLYRVIGKLMKRMPGDLLFLESGSEQILRKENGTLIVNSNLDEYQKKYLTSDLLRFLDHKYMREKLTN
ncbi:MULTISPECIES: hypothetical protein [Bacillaceae]|uniref:hypothetical protein n=1 Tax=Metabacillus sp. 22489 TaxID=3453928 RepID=UPI000BA7BAC4|nr:hypothetical protein CHH83_24015 [Bacillus sp. 7586-K]